MTELELRGAFDKFLKKIFKKFQHTLDPTPLDVLSEHNQKKLFDRSKNNLNKSWGRILYNHFSEYSRKKIVDLTELSEKNPLFISGPMSLTKHESEEYGKTIYIFGDYHGIINACDEQYEPLTILKFFDTYTKNIDKFIDIYIEAEYIKTESGDEIKFDIPEYHSISFLSDVINYLLKQPNIRIHKTDLREYLNITRSDVLRKIAYRLDFIKLTKKDLKQFLEDFNDITFQEMLLSKPVKKQLKKIADKTLMEKLLQFMTNEVQRFNCDTDYLDLIRNRIRKSIKEKIPIKKIFCKYLFKNIYLCTNFIMDIYLLARLFKTFDIEKSGDFHPTEAKNVFIYAGETHAETYRFFLESIGFSEKYIATQEDKRCIRIFEPIVF